MGEILEWDIRQSGKNRFGFNVKRMKYYVHSRSTSWVEVDLVKSKNVPVYDFDVNRLMFMIVGGKWTPSDYLFDGQDMSRHFLNILERKATLLPDFCKYIVTTPASSWQEKFQAACWRDHHRWQLCVDGINRKFYPVPFFDLLMELCQEEVEKQNKSPINQTPQSSGKAEDLEGNELRCPCCQQKVLLPNKPLKGLIDVEKFIQFMWNSSVKK